MHVQVTMKRSDIPEHLLKYFRPVPPIKRKDDIQIPARFALAAQADGWWVRRDIIWAKGLSFLPNYAGSCMPESVTDRPTTGHEYIYLLTKNQHYFYDAEAVKEDSIQPERIGKIEHAFSVGDASSTLRNDTGRSVERRSTRNLRSVWAINPKPYSGAHFAVWPQELVEPMIKAGSSAHGVCPACGKPWARVVERESSTAARNGGDGNWVKLTHIENGQEPRAGGFYDARSTTTGWEPTCTCDAGDPIPATILDCFNGSGTSGRAALKLGRSYIGVDVSAEYLTELAPERMSNVQMEMAL